MASSNDGFVFLCSVATALLFYGYIMSIQTVIVDLKYHRQHGLTWFALAYVILSTSFCCVCCRSVHTESKRCRTVYTSSTTATATSQVRPVPETDIESASPCSTIAIPYAIKIDILPTYVFPHKKN